MRVKQKIKIRKSIRCLYLFFATALLLCSLFSLVQLFSDNNLQMLNYEMNKHTTKFNTKYTVNIIENDFIDDETQPMGLVYVSDLIDTIDFDLNYLFNSTISDDFKYNYEIIGVLQAVYSKDGTPQEVINKKYTLLEKQSKTVLGNKIEINEQINIDVKEYNDFIKEFEQSLNMNVEATYKVRLKVNIASENISSNYTSNIVFDIAERTTSIQGDLSEEKTGYDTKEVQLPKEIDATIIILDAIAIMIAIVIYRYVFTKTVPARNIRSTYRLELNRILRLCQDKIVQVSGNIEIEQSNVVEVKDFGEIIKLSEELFKPILCCSSKEEEQTWFVVMSSNVSYRYILRGSK